MYKTHYRAVTSVLTENEKERDEEDENSSQPSSVANEILRVEIEKPHPPEEGSDHGSSLAENERESEGGESTKVTRQVSSDSFFQQENSVEAVDYVRLDNSSKSLDPYVGIQEEISFPRGSFPLYKPTLLRRKRSVDLHQLTRTTTTARGIASVDTEEEYSRRSSNFSIPYFYPDPYSIVFSRYSDELGSISSTSTAASGSETTEYLQLSENGSLLSSPEEIAESKKKVESERRLTKSSLICVSNDGTFDDKMNFASALSTSEEYQSFRSSVPLKRICVESDGTKEWKVYDAGPRSVRTPLLCLGPACASSDIFYRQVLNLTARGFRVLSVEGPVYWSVEDWCKGLKKLLDSLNLDKVHIFGASLGGFLAQKFAEHTYHYSRVASLILCNTFLDTSIFDYHDSAMIFWMLPSVILKKLIVENITSARIMDLDIAHAIEFMIERLNNLSQQELASRMTLNCVNCHVDTFKLKQTKITIMDVFDESALSNQAREELYKNFTEAKLAHLKSGGNFPYLSRNDEVNMHLMVHLRTFNGTKHSAQLEETTVDNAITESANKENGIAISKSVKDSLASTETAPMLPSSLQDANQEFKEKAASVLG